MSFGLQNPSDAFCHELCALVDEMQQQKITCRRVSVRYNVNSTAEQRGGWSLLVSEVPTTKMSLDLIAAIDAVLRHHGCVTLELH